MNDPTVVRAGELEGLFTALSNELMVPSVVLPVDLWDRTDLSHVEKATGWVAFRDAMIGQTPLVGQGSMMTERSLITFCPDRMVGITRHLTGPMFNIYTGTVVGYLRIMHQLLLDRVAPGDRGELERLTDSRLYDENRNGWMLLLEVAWKATYGTGQTGAP